MEKLLAELDLNKEVLIISPGNHDRFIEDIMRNPKYPINIDDSDSKWYKFESENIEDRFSEFIAFSKDLLIPLKVKNCNNYLAGFRDVQGIRFIVLNSARYACGGSEDKGKLFLGWPDVNDLVGDKIFFDLNRSDDPAIIVSLFHHPDNWFHDNVLHQRGNHPATYNFLAERCHVMLSGHVHATKIGPARKIVDGAIHFFVGASYLRQDYVNNCEILRFDLPNKDVERLIINFDPSEVEWVPKFNEVKKIGLEGHTKEITVRSYSQIEEKGEEQIINIKKHTKKGAFEILKKVENVNNKISEILPDYLDFLLEIDEKQEKIWVNIEISGNIHKNKENYKEQLKYREILSYISKSRIIHPRGYSIEMMKAENPQLFKEHYWLADYTIQELEEIAIEGDTQILGGYYNREGLEFYNYTSVSSIKQILTRIRKKISEFLIDLINS